MSLILVIAVLVGAPAPKEGPKKEPPSIVGRWLVESLVQDGKADKVDAGACVTFGEKGRALVKEGADEAGIKMDYTIDSARTPTQIDLFEVTDKRETTRGIYRIEGDTLMICFSTNGKRPVEFASAVGSNHKLITLKRAR